MLRVCAIALVLAAVVAAAADAAPPRAATVHAVSDGGDHLRVDWDLPVGTVAMTVEIASQPFTDWGGFFWAQNVVAVARLHPADRVFDTTPGALPPGTYWAHVQTFDPECAAGVGSYERMDCITWSTAVSGTKARPANQRPTLSVLRLASHARNALMEVCDDTFPGQLVFRATLSVNRFGRGSATRSRSQSVDQPAPRDGTLGCRAYNVALPDLNGVGRYTLKMTVTDSRGARSNTVVRRWTTSD
jgi:hypothetical protein